jgi:hypothetical protein
MLTEIETPRLWLRPLVPGGRGTDHGCAWTRISWLKPIQAGPKDGKPLTGMRRPAADAALAELAGEIADLLLTPISRASSRP